jgi:hypothetical protein
MSGIESRVTGVMVAAHARAAHFGPFEQTDVRCAFIADELRRPGLTIRSGVSGNNMRVTGNLLIYLSADLKQVAAWIAA